MSQSQARHISSWSLGATKPAIRPRCIAALSHQQAYAATEIMRPAYFLNALGAVSVLQAPVLASSISVSDVVRRSLAAFAKRDVASEILSDIENLADCPACEVPLPARAVRKGRSAF